MRAKTARDLLWRTRTDTDVVIDYIEELASFTENLDTEEIVPDHVRRSCERAAEAMFNLRLKLEEEDE